MTISSRPQRSTIETIDIDLLVPNPVDGGLIGGEVVVS
jgi:hypothetical protein